MIALLLLVGLVLFVGVGLLINVYLYKHHALRTVPVRSVSLDDQLFPRYANVDSKEVW